jgi:hypothetical protein
MALSGKEILVLRQKGHQIIVGCLAVFGQNAWAAQTHILVGTR